MYKLTIFLRTSEWINIKFFKSIKKNIKSIKNILSILDLVAISDPRWGLVTKSDSCGGIALNMVVTSKTFSHVIVLRHESL
jgi:hypothetical protein